MLHPLIPTRDKTMFAINSQQPFIFLEKTVFPQSSKTVSLRLWQSELQVLFLVRTRLHPLLPCQSFTLLSAFGDRSISTIGPEMIYGRYLHLPFLMIVPMHPWSRISAMLHPLIQSTSPILCLHPKGGSRDSKPWVKA
ncbi:hypothetical protein V6N13_030510 [Hibiscus sabdariffa]